MSSADVQALIDTVVNGPDRYYDLPIPSPHDEALSTVIRRSRNLSEEERQEIHRALQEKGKLGVLHLFGFRMAILAVRRNEGEFITDGLLALGIEDFQDDYRNTLRLLSLLFRSCERLNLPGRQLLEEAAAFALPSARKYLLNFAQHPSTIAEMHIAEEGSGPDFRYKAIESWKTPEGGKRKRRKRNWLTRLPIWKHWFS